MRCSQMARRSAALRAAWRSVNLAGRSADVEVMTDGLGITALRLTYQTPLPARSFHEPRETCEHVYQWVDRNVA